MNARHEAATHCLHSFFSLPAATHFAGKRLRGGDSIAEADLQITHRAPLTS
jgi:hypothetical protein